MKEKTLSRREKEKLIHRNQILTVAFELFSEKGYHSVSMYEIAKKAEFSIGTLYNFFKNKEELYRVLIINKTEEQSHILSEVLSKEDDIQNIIREFIAAETKFFESNLALIRFYLAEKGLSCNIRAGVYQEWCTINNKTMGKVASLLKKGICSNVIRKIDPLQLSMALRGLISGFLLYRLESPNQHPLEDDVSLITELFLKGCLINK